MGYHAGMHSYILSSQINIVFDHRVSHIFIQGIYSIVESSHLVTPYSIYLNCITIISALVLWNSVTVIILIAEFMYYFYLEIFQKMAVSNIEDLIISGAELSCPITIERGKTSRTYRVIAYPTQLTRKITNDNADGKTTSDPNAIKKCRWHTTGIIRFHHNPETNLIYEARPAVHELEITLKRLLNETHKQQLATQAEEIYGFKFTANNFVICQFQTFIAQLTIEIGGDKKTFYGILFDNTELDPIRIIFNIEDKDELSNIASKLDHPHDHDIILSYEYSLSGTSTVHASLKVSAEEVSQINLERTIFGTSTADSMVVSRSFMDKITGTIADRLNVVQNIGVGASSFSEDLIKQQIANAMSVRGFQKFSIDDIKKMQSDGMEITEDLKANKINYYKEDKHNSSALSHHSLDISSSAYSSDILDESSGANKQSGSQSSKSSKSRGLRGGVGKLNISGEFNKKKFK
jgi:hypothetical protein